VEGAEKGGRDHTHGIANMMSMIREVHFCNATTHPRDLSMLLCRRHSRERAEERVHFHGDSGPRANQQQFARSHVKRIVVASSTAAVMDLPLKPTVR